MTVKWQDELYIALFLIIDGRIYIMDEGEYYPDTVTVDGLWRYDLIFKTPTLKIFSSMSRHLSHLHMYGAEFEIWGLDDVLLFL